MPGSRSKFGAHVLVLFMRTYMDGCGRGRSDRGWGEVMYMPEDLEGRNTEVIPLLIYTPFARTIDRRGVFFQGGGPRGGGAGGTSEFSFLHPEKVLHNLVSVWWFSRADQDRSVSFLPSLPCGGTHKLIDASDRGYGVQCKRGCIFSGFPRMYGHRAGAPQVPLTYTY